MTLYRCFGTDPICAHAYTISDPAGGYDTGCNDFIGVGTLFCTGKCKDYIPSNLRCNPSAIRPEDEIIEISRR